MTFFCKSRPDHRQRLPVSDRRRSPGRRRRRKGPPKPESEARGRRPAHSGPRPAFSEAGRARGQFLRSPMLRIKTRCGPSARGGGPSGGPPVCPEGSGRTGGGPHIQAQDRPSQKRVARGGNFCVVRCFASKRAARGRRPICAWGRPKRRPTGLSGGIEARGGNFCVVRCYASKRAAAHLRAGAHLRVGGKTRPCGRYAAGAEQNGQKDSPGRTGGCAADKARPHGRIARAAVRRRSPVIPQDSAPTGAPTARAAAPNPSTSRT